ncbi:MAG: phosphatidylserine decarboxylase [Gammaproteobacteria bacterium]|jgi:phosphatidylserine decarboxylase|nr:phosphatidylserine decarboxylase [Gammaproteobacteria bacterium]MBT4461858.1 phosphatidylserine decarboxylase [Gammaproteobacteria bacterium]MBT4654247.1 phosphatidylserine decarboxylase [Gammaproteobacteria bacterium]MBT5116775.1 phosphatidylserine decarboxylase [Gammaproteobacteria bacterium]MBT5761152.1 phosphatidylserine decarboxylase [Gammaproteobacteria bacterium]
MIKDIREALKAYWLFIIPHHLFSRFTYIITRTHHPLTSFLIRTYINFFKVNMKECEQQSIDKYNTFCDFFTRKLKSGIHKIDDSEESIVSSCDGKILEYGKIKDNTILQVKGKTITIDELLDHNKKTKDTYKDGSFVTIYLSPKDYHRVHSPLSGKLMRTIQVPGRLFSVADHAVKYIKKLYSRNERLVCSFRDKNINFSVIFVAAINVSSIEVAWKGEVSPPMPKKTITTDYEKKKVIIEKGKEVGMFKSGSTVILLFDLKAKLSSTLKRGKYVRVGNKIGMIKS